MKSSEFKWQIYGNEAPHYELLLGRKNDKIFRIKSSWCMQMGETENMPCKNHFLINVARLSATLHRKLNRNSRFRCILGNVRQVALGKIFDSCAIASDLGIYDSLQTALLSSRLNVRLTSAMHFTISRTELPWMNSPSENNEFRSWLRHQLSFCSLPFFLFIQLRRKPQNKYL